MRATQAAMSNCPLLPTSEQIEIAVLLQAITRSTVIHLVCPLSGLPGWVQIEFLLDLGRRLWKPGKRAQVYTFSGNRDMYRDGAEILVANNCPCRIW